ncbi:YtxH domain-containing protein [Sphingobium sp. D43FB]|uniref:YtxH domain-containing protein n=1 Tax=Sphingobium sp. D43FB TaxID=2017595 RepID=UPI000BB56692|nr:YtxH domain-containing protein [Sphingobium sp. D43FB]PBN44649.1 hypothetical protein SxD43FB_05645 [Sphingobium sp. D43FB]
MGKQSDHNASPTEFAQASPRNLYDTSDIRFVMMEVAKLTDAADRQAAANAKLGERIDAQGEKLTTSLDAHGQKLTAAFERLSEKLTADLKDRTLEIKTGAKERADEIKKDLSEKATEIKGEVKDLRNSVVDLEKNLSFYRGALRVLGLGFAIFIVLVGVGAKFLVDKLG